MALKLLVGGAVSMRESELLQEILHALAGEPLMAVLLAAVMTVLTHSGLAIILLVISFAATNIVTPSLALALVIGANLGSVFPPIFATWADGVLARRVTLGNALFRVVGCTLAILFIGEIGSNMTQLGSDPARQIVNFHTALNVFIAAVFLPLTGVAAACATRLMPEPPVPQDPGTPKHLDRDRVNTPQVALASAAREAVRMGEIVEDMLKKCLAVFKSDDPQMIKEITATDDTVDQLYREIKFYVTDVTRGTLDSPQSRRAAEILSFSMNLEHIGDIVENLTEIVGKKIKNKLQFSDDGLSEIVAMHEAVITNLSLAVGLFMSGDERMARHLLAEKKRLNEMERQAIDSHMARLRDGWRESMETSGLHIDIIRDLRRIHTHLVAVAYPVLETVSVELESERLLASSSIPSANTGVT